MFGLANPELSNGSPFLPYFSENSKLICYCLDKESDDDAHLKHLITQVFHLIGIDYSEDCRKGSVDAAYLEEILEDPAAAMEENAIRSQRKAAKGKAADTNYSSVRPNR